MIATFTDDWENVSANEWWWFNYTIRFTDGIYRLERYADTGGSERWLATEWLGDYPDLNRAILYATDHWYLRRFPRLVPGHAQERKPPCFWEEERPGEPLETLAGTDIQDAISEAIRLAALKNEPVSFRFNGVVARVTRHSNNDSVYKQWSEDFRKRNAVS